MSERMIDTDRLVAEAESYLEKAVNSDGGRRDMYFERAGAIALVAIAQELRKINERAELELERVEHKFSDDWRVE